MNFSSLAESPALPVKVVKMKILVVDDEKSIGMAIQDALRMSGHEVLATDCGEMALAMMRKNPPDILFTDLRMDGLGGMELLNKTRQHFPTFTAVVMTAQGTIESAVNAIKGGAYDYIQKPFTLDQLEMLVEKIGKLRSLKEENTKLRDRLERLTPPSSISTRNAKMQKLLETAQKVAVTESTVLITGESGTGKTMLAKLMHEKSVRATHQFSVVNCATLSENLLESELFGHVRGSFTGAVKDKLGRLQVADGGTIFLDEIGEISPGLQSKLLRFLQEREFERVGDTKTIRVDVRIIAATNKNLEIEVQAGRFREDLYFRLNVIELHMLSLRQRTEDIPDLVDSLLQQSFAMVGRPYRPLSIEARAAVVAYPWPGNIRELKNALERAAILSSADEVCIEDLPDRIIESAHSEMVQLGTGVAIPAAVVGTNLAASKLSLDELERIHIQNVLATTETLEEAASILGVNLSTLWRKRRQYGLN